MKLIRDLLVKFGYKPWLRNNIVSAWHDEKTGLTQVMYCTRDGYRELYVDHGLNGTKALEYETMRISPNTKFIIIDKSTLPACRLNRHRWIVNFNRERVEIK